MEIIKGKFAIANVFAPDISSRARSDLLAILDSPCMKGRKIALMPDCHPNGDGTLTGFTMTDGEEAILGLEDDAGCGVSYVRLDIKKEDVDFALLDEACHAIPAGRGRFYLEPAYSFDFSRLRCYDAIKKELSYPVFLGSLGGGNHFIELDEDEEGTLYLLVHNGLGMYSGLAVDYYKKLALSKSANNGEKTLENTLLYGKDKADFHFDMAIFEELCRINRAYITDTIVEQLGYRILERQDICHHFYSGSDGVSRHGAVSSKRGEPIIIPVNAKEGSLLGIGKGNPDWNCSAPHGGGRLYSRKKAKESFTMEDYQNQMKGIFSSTVFSENLDEIPSAYRQMNDILEAVKDTMEVQHILRPLYNYKGK